VVVRVEKPFAFAIRFLKPFIAFPSSLPVFKQSDKEMSTPLTPRPKGRSLFRVDPEPRSFTPFSKAGLGAAERVNSF
jgi:hypothetical protein